MKKIYFILIITLFFSCFEKQTMYSPTLTIEPDSIENISPINPVEYILDGYASEDLTYFKVETYPFIYKFDTVFPPYTHKLEYELVLSLPEFLNNLPEDSIINVTFTLADAFNKTEIQRQLRVIYGFPAFITDSVTLVYEKDSTMFFSFETGNVLNFDEIEDTNFDIVLVYDNVLGFILCSPDAFYVSPKMVELQHYYTITGKKHTAITLFSTSMNLVDAKFLYYMSVGDAYIDNNLANGVGVESLQVGDMLAIKCDNGKKGVLEIYEINTVTKSLSYFVKVQK